MKTKFFFFPLMAVSLIAATMSAITPKSTTPAQPPMYTVDFDGMNFAYIDPRTGEPPKSLYAVGELVLFRFEIWATDTSYKFYLDGEEVNASYFDDKYGYCFYFMMPDHDVKFTQTSRNTMIYDPSEEQEKE